MKDMKSSSMYNFIKNEYPVKYGCEYPLKSDMKHAARTHHIMAFISKNFKFGNGGGPKYCFEEIRYKIQTRREIHQPINRLCQWYLEEQYSYQNDHEYAHELVRLTSDSYEF